VLSGALFFLIVVLLMLANVTEMFFCWLQCHRVFVGVGLFRLCGSRGQTRVALGQQVPCIKSAANLCFSSAFARKIVCLYNPQDSS
jgi:hypothetical protein